MSENSDNVFSEKLDNLWLPYINIRSTIKKLCSNLENLSGYIVGFLELKYNE